MTCCVICKITKGESIEESVCGCPQIHKFKSESCPSGYLISFRGHVFDLDNFILISDSANPDLRLSGKELTLQNKSKVVKN